MNRYGARPTTQPEREYIDITCNREKVLPDERYEELSHTRAAAIDSEQPMSVLLPLLFALLAAPVTLLAGTLRAKWAARAGAAMAAVTLSALLWGNLIGGGWISRPWAPDWHLNWSFRLDGLAVLYALLAAGIGLAVIFYSSSYIPIHLAHEQQAPGNALRFYALLLLFMGAMTGLAMADDLLLIFLFWDLTAITSYFLIGYDHHQKESRHAALMALAVTGITAVLFLIGALLLFSTTQTFSLSELIRRSTPGWLLTVACALMAVAALAKSAQVPFHFWLPRAMAAPTPVSAYLHSAAMVAAGVFLLSRIYPLLQRSEVLLDGLLIVGMLSVILGSVLALTHDKIKEILAYSTIAQYGYVVMLLGLGGDLGATAASLYVLAHAVCKCALFLTAGAIKLTTGEDCLSRLGGLGREMPWLAAASGVAAAGLAAFPLTIGFFKDELLFQTALKRGWPPAVFATASASLTLAYSWRFWSGIFLGPPDSSRTAHIDSPRTALPRGLIAPIVVLALLILTGGVLNAPFAHLAEAAGAVILGARTPIEPAYHLDARPESLLALASYVLGAGIIISRRFWIGTATAFARLGERAGPERIYRKSLRRLHMLSSRVHRIEAYDLRDRVSTILVTTVALLGAGIVATPWEGNFLIGAMNWQDLPLVLSLMLTALAILASVLMRKHLPMVLAVSTVNFGLIAVFVELRAPDVALAAVIIGVVSILMLLGILSLFPHSVLRREERLPPRAKWRWNEHAVGVIAGIGALAVAWGVLSTPASEPTVAVELARLTPAAHGLDIVTVILADFRGLDTLGEITVITIVLLGVRTLVGLREAR